MADIFDVLSDATRRDLLDRLRTASDGELSVGALVEQTSLTQPTVSKHLRVLREQGLVGVREEAQHRFYRLDAAPLAAVEAWLRPFVATPDPAPAAEGMSAAGSAVAERLGRAAASSMHQAQEVLRALREATERLRAQLVE